MPKGIGYKSTGSRSVSRKKLSARRSDAGRSTAKKSALRRSRSGKGVELKIRPRARMAMTGRGKTLRMR